MRQALELGISQHLTMTPQLQQAIRLLQLSTVELQEEIREALETNPLLEVDEEGTDPPPASPGFDGEASAGATPVADDVPVDVHTQQQNLPEDLAQDVGWEDTYMDLAPPGGARDEDSPDFTAVATRPQTLQDHLLWQLSLTPFSDADREIATLIVDAVRPDGYLGQTLDELAEAARAVLDPPPDPDDMLAVLHRVHAFDPPGVAARSVGECLALQVRQLGLPEAQRAAALAVIAHLDLLGSGEFKALGRATQLPAEALAGAVHLVRSLNPRPGNSYDETEPEYIVPDVLVRRVRGAWEVELNPAVAPRLRLNDTYAAMVRRRDRSADNIYLREKLGEARWFLSSLRSRHDTLLAVARCIVRRQAGYFEHGPEGMVPMVLQDVAEELGMHQSTVSRVTSRKYMHCARGVLELKYFFSSHVRTSDGGAASATAIREQIRTFIAAETAPLSDSQLAAMLHARGIEVARRTVAKYRESLGIPSSSERRRPAAVPGG
jgi:RNA polymerase sigma-54 factor